MHEQARPHIILHDLGRIDYQDAWELQGQLLKGMVDHKRSQRDKPPSDRLPQQHHFLFCEHPPVYTLGKSGKEDHLLLSEAERQAQQIAFYKINRGGDITFHGPGQIVGYPIFDLEYFFTDVHKYVRYLEEAVIRTLGHYNLTAERLPGYTGVWLPPEGSKKSHRKICAIGVHLSRWVTMHGFAFNVNTPLQYFENIIPCGIADADKAVTSMQKELGFTPNHDAVKEQLMAHFSDLFQFDWSLATPKH